MFINIKKFDLKRFGDKDGNLFTINSFEELPFIPNRLFYITDLNFESVRGEHASKTSKFLIVSQKGKVKVDLYRGDKKETFVLEGNGEGVYLPVMTWMKLYDFEEESMVMVIASKEYIKEDYIEQFDEYLLEYRDYNNRV